MNTRAQRSRQITASLTVCFSADMWAEVVHLLGDMNDRIYPGFPSRAIETTPIGPSPSSCNEDGNTASSTSSTTPCPAMVAWPIPIAYKGYASMVTD